MKASANPFYAPWANARSRAKRRGNPFRITVHMIQWLWKGRCECCGRAMDQPGTKGVGRLYAPSLDEIDPGFGYELGNIGWLCGLCNVRKRDSTVGDLQRLMNYMEYEDNGTYRKKAVD